MLPSKHCTPLQTFHGLLCMPCAERLHSWTRIQPKSSHRPDKILLVDSQISSVFAMVVSIFCVKYQFSFCAHLSSSSLSLFSFLAIKKLRDNYRNSLKPTIMFLLISEVSGVSLYYGQCAE